MLINEQAINDTFNSWLKKYGFSARVYGMDYEFAYYPEENDITYSFLYQETVENAWNEFFEHMGCKYIISHFWSSFFHELGHSETMSQLTEEEIEYSAIRAEVANNAEYFELPREIIATKWAVNFINNEIDKVIELINMLRPLMEEILD